MSECGGVRIQFPPSGSKSEEVKLHGPQEDVERAKTMLLDLADDQVGVYVYAINAYTMERRLSGTNLSSEKNLPTF